MRTCLTCQQLRDENGFSFCVGLNGTQYRRNTCNVCRSTQAKKQRYKLTDSQWEALWTGRCAICLSTENLCIDHNHQTGKIRGILCNVCNLTLGRVNEDIDRLRNMINYLEQDHE